jgi:hypothetical protein
VTTELLVVTPCRLLVGYQTVRRHISVYQQLVPYHCDICAGKGKDTKLAGVALVSMKTGWKNLGSNPGNGKLFFPSPKRPNPLWDPPSLLFNSYKGLSAWWYGGRGGILTTHLHLVSRFRINGVTPPLLYAIS